MSAAIAVDMQSVFRDARGGFMDKSIGMRLRKEIYEAGGARDINESIEAFMGREPSLDAFLESIGASG